MPSRPDPVPYGKCQFALHPTLSVRSNPTFYTKRAKDSSDRAPFFRLQSRRGPQTAICADAASILTAIYHMLKSGLPHRDLGANSCDRRSPEAKARRLVSQLAKLGFAAQLQPPADAT